MIQGLFSRAACKLSERLATAARKRVLVAVLLFAVAVGGRCALLRWIPIPQPGIQDEFSYLLAADTFSSLRLTNPQHPMWVHFETVHEIVRPTYQSKYGPLQGLLLAVGQIFFKQPWFGVLIGIGLMNVAIWWALSGWLPPRWALLGAILALLRVGFITYWSESYWGGGGPAMAGALVIGAVPRLRSRVTAGSAIALATGLALLAMSRPYEGLVLGAGCLGAILIKVPANALLRPMAAVLIPAALWLGYYNYRVTGSPLSLPYRVHERQYATWSPFIWDTHPRPAPHYNSEDMRATWIGWEQMCRGFERAHFLPVRLNNTITLDQFFLGIPWTICLLAFLAAIFRTQPKLRVAIVLAALFVLGAEMETNLWPHYCAPATALVFVIATAALRRLFHFSPALMFVALVCIAGGDLLRVSAKESRWLYDKRDFICQRDYVMKRLEASPTKKLVLVEYGARHNINHEWIYNKADIDASGIVWARAMGAKDDELLQYYKGREVWRLLEDGPSHLELSRR